MTKNFLLLTVDDMNYNSKEFYNGDVSSLTPHLDQLAREGGYFSNSHVTVAVCQPSRSVLLTGRYPHRNGARGFERISEGIPTLTGILRENGYLNGIIGKETHIQPMEAFAWDHVYSTYNQENDFGRSPDSYYRDTRTFVQTAKTLQKPFFFMANSHDPHRPFACSEDELPEFGRNIPVSRTFQPEDVIVPAFLPDLPEIRLEIAQYLTSVHRADATVGKILQALQEEDVLDDTVILFLSDNGMAMPFAKANCYLNSTKSPYIVRWPGVVMPNTLYDALVASIDYMPTMLDIAGIEKPEGMDGTSLVDLLRGACTEHDHEIFTQFYKTAKNQTTKRELHFPMRCIQDKRLAYIYNSWSDGQTTYRSESMSGLTFDAMEKAADSNPAIERRVNMYLHREKEELYDYFIDPDALNNLVHNPEYAYLHAQFRNLMKQYMEKSNDELLPQFQMDIGNI